MSDTHEPSAPRNLWGPLTPLGEALRFLTILPLPGLVSAAEGGMGPALACFPLAGLVIGVLLSGVGWLAGLLWNGSVQAVLIVVAWAIVTAGLHLDGVSDTFDAVLSWRSRERKLEIMKDSRIGALGALALVSILLLKCALIGAAGPAWAPAIWLAPVLARAAQLHGMFWFPPARPDGMGQSVKAQMRLDHVLVGSVVAAVLAVAIGQLRGVIALALVAGTTYALCRWWVRDLGGLTGDTYGALAEICEVVALAAMSALV